MRNVSILVDDILETRNWHDLCHCAHWLIGSGDRIRTEILATVREKGILEHQDSSERKILEIDVLSVSMPHRSPLYPEGRASILGLSIYQKPNQLPGLHIALTFTEFGSFWVFSPCIFCKPSRHLQSHTACPTNTWACGMPPTQHCILAWEVRHAAVLWEVPVSVALAACRLLWWTSETWLPDLAERPRTCWTAGWSIKGRTEEAKWRGRSGHLRVKTWVGLETRFEKRLTLDLSLFSCLVGPNFFFWIHFHVDTLDVDLRMWKVSALDVR